MRLIQIDHNPSSRDLNLFGAIWLVFFGIVGGILFSSGSSIRVAALVWAIAVLAPAIGWIVPGFMRFVYIGMAYAAFPIGFVVSYLIMAVVYYLVLTPIGLVMRLFRYDPMNRRFDRSTDTYWCPREQKRRLNAYFRQF
jgi:hypothetical protein